MVDTLGLVQSIRKPNQEQRDFSKANWQRYWKEDGWVKEVVGKDGRTVGIFQNWIRGREIHVFRMPGVREEVVEAVILGINDMIREIRLLDFLIDKRRNYFGPHKSAVMQVRMAMTREGRLDEQGLAELIIAERWRNPLQGGRPHADVVITDQFLSLGYENWGQAKFDYGYVLIAVPGRRQKSLDFIRNVAKHEAGHLFGFREHHDSHPDIPGYESIDDCNMLWRASSYETCGKCLDAMVHVWKGIEEKYGEKFLK